MTPRTLHFEVDEQAWELSYRLEMAELALKDSLHPTSLNGGNISTIDGDILRNLPPVDLGGE